MVYNVYGGLRVDIMKNKEKNMIWYMISVIVIALDQITKLVIKSNLEYGEKIPVIRNFLYITYHTNTGAAWGMLSNATVFLTVFSGLMALALVFIIPRFHNKCLKWATCLILGGAVGNQIDRLLQGKVTDFIATFYWGYGFPVFNIADSAIVIGSVLLLVYMFFFYNDEDFAFMNTGKGKKGKEGL